MINRCMTMLVEQLHDDGVDDPLARPMLLAALWSDLCRLADEIPPAILNRYLGDDCEPTPTPSPSGRTVATEIPNALRLGVARRG